MLPHISIRYIFSSNPVALPDLYFHWSVWPVVSFVIRARGIVTVVSSIVPFSNHRPCLESYRLSVYLRWCKLLKPEPCSRIDPAYNYLLRTSRKSHRIRNQNLSIVPVDSVVSPTHYRKRKEKADHNQHQTIRHP